MARRSLDLSQRVLKVYAPVGQFASSRGPTSLAHVTLAARGICLSAGRESWALSAESDAMRSRARQGGKT
jgi:hypothetical protein